MFFLPVGSCIFLSVRRGVGRTFLGFGFWLVILGLCLAKTARNAARFSFFVFSGCFFFWKVLPGLGFCSDNFCLINCRPLSGPFCALDLC